MFFILNFFLITLIANNYGDIHFTSNYKIKLLHASNMFCLHLIEIKIYNQLSY